MSNLTSWRELSVDDLCLRVTSGGTPKRTVPEYYSPATIPWVKTGDLLDTYVSSYSEYISDRGLQESSAKILPTDTVLMAMYGATVGALGILSEEATCNQASCALITDPEVCNPRWLFYALLNGRNYIVSQATGAAQQNLSGKTIRQFRFLTPPISEQRAIAEVLGALDDKIAANSMKASTAEQLAGVLFDKVSVDLNKIPVSQVLTPILGGTPNRKNPEFWGGQVHWASAKDVTSAPHSVVADTEEKITRMATEQTKAKPLPIGGVIVTARGTVGAVARLALPTSFNQSCYGFSPSELPPGLLYFSILRAAQRAKSLSHGSVFDTITMKTFDHLFIPDFGESAEKMEHQIAPLLETVDSSIKENKTLVSMRDALLPQLMSGKLRVRDAEAVVEDVL